MDLFISWYEQALKSTSTSAVEKLVERYGKAQCKFLSSFSHDELYKAISDMDNVLLTVEGAEEDKIASLKIYVTCVQPLQILYNAVDGRRKIF